MITGLLFVQSQEEADFEAASRLSVAANRVQSIARPHQKLHNTQTVEFKAYLDEPCRDHLTMSEERPDRLIIVEAKA